VEIIKNYFREKFNVNYNSIQVDWILWQMGEELKDEIFPHHRTLSIFY
jgi:hypothetical protein